MPTLPRPYAAPTSAIAMPPSTRAQTAAPALPTAQRTRVATATSATSGWAARLQTLLAPAPKPKPR